MGLRISADRLLRHAEHVTGDGKLGVRYGLVIPALDPTTGMLPVGRHPCSEAEFEARFVSDAAFASSTTRRDLWDDWQQALQLLQGAVTVHAAWLGGSFTTSKLDPDDIDVTFLINVEDYKRRQPQDQQMVSTFAAVGQVKAVLGLRLDSYVIGWESVPNPQQAGRNGDGDAYYWARGHWDDWWQRCRGVTADPAPRRGYLEVLFSDYP